MKAWQRRGLVQERLGVHERDGTIPTNSRFLFYELEGKNDGYGVLVSKVKTGARRPDQDLIDALTALREQGSIPWDWIVDETRHVESVWHMLATEWSALAGTGGKPIAIGPYDSSGDGLAYVLKLAERSDCPWDFSDNLSLFFPESVDLSNAQGRRRYRRHLARANSPLMTASDNAAITI